MPAAERHPSDEQFDPPYARSAFDAEFQGAADEPNRLLLARLTEQAARLRAAARVLGERVDQLGRLAAHRRGS